MGNRSRTEIVAMILDAANEGGETKTKIMYFAFLSYNQLKEYLSVLVENNLIDIKQQKKDCSFLKCIMNWKNYYHKLLQSKMTN